MHIISLDHEIDRKRNAKSYPKSFKNGAMGAQGLDFYDFELIFDAPFLFVFFGAAHRFRVDGDLGSGRPGVFWGGDCVHVALWGP